LRKRNYLISIAVASNQRWKLLRGPPKIWGLP